MEYKNKKHSISEKEELARLCSKYKEEYEKQEKIEKYNAKKRTFVNSSSNTAGQIHPCTINMPCTIINFDNLAPFVRLLCTVRLLILAVFLLCTIKSSCTFIRYPRVLNNILLVACKVKV